MGDLRVSIYFPKAAPFISERFPEYFHFFVPQVDFLKLCPLHASGHTEGCLTGKDVQLLITACIKASYPLDSNCNCKEITLFLLKGFFY